MKNKLRQLKKLEIKIRFRGQGLPPNHTLVWNEFFSTRVEDDPSVRYPLSRLYQMDRLQRKEVFGEYFYWVYFQHFQENGLTPTNVYDPALLSLLGLPPHAGLQEIKSKFRALAKKYHPDHGGDAARFIEMMDIYEQLAGSP
jgi:hypothetical protein